MTRYIGLSATALVSLAFAAPAVAEHPLDGTWKADIKTAQLPTKPDVILLKSGMFECSTCTPPLKVAADGAFHAVAGRDYADEASVTIVDDHTVRYANRLRGKDVSSATDSVSADGNTLTTKWQSTNNATGTPTEGISTETRVAAAPTGAHIVSGSWKQTKVDAMSDANLTVTYKVDGDTVMMTQPTGEHYTAKFGGPMVAIDGDPGKTMVTVKKLGTGGVEETNMRGGKTVGIFTFVPAADGKSALGTWNDTRAGTKTSYTAYKQ